MQENVENEDTISLADIFHALLSKLWIILVTLVVGIGAGLAFGYVQYHDVHYYGARTEFYISSDNNKTNNSSDQTGTGTIPQAYKQTVFDCIIGSVDDSEDFFRESFLPQLTTLGEEYNVSIPTRQSGEDPANYTDYYRLYQLFCSGISYSYTLSSNDSVNNVLVVNVSLLNKEKLAQNFVIAIQKTLPGYIEESLKNDVFGVSNCVQKTNLIGSSALLNGGQMKREMMKYALLLGVAAAAVACVVIVIIDRMDTRLRDFEVIPQRFGIPVLGVIPRIDLLPEEDKKMHGGIQS